MSKRANMTRPFVRMKSLDSAATQTSTLCWIPSSPMPRTPAPMQSIRRIESEQNRPNRALVGWGSQRTGGQGA